MNKTSKCLRAGSLFTKNLVKIAFCLVAVFFAFNGNAKVEKSDLLGTWTQTETEQGVTVISTYDFKDDNTVTQFFMMNSSNPKMNVIAEGTAQYTFNGETLTFKFSASDFNFTTFEIEGLPQEYVGVAKQQMMSQMVNVEQKITDININGKTLTGKFDGQTVTLQKN